MIANSPVPENHVVRRSARGAAARERILLAATEAFARDGFQGCSLARIAAEVGLSQAGVLHHFPTKEGLLVAVLDERDRLDIERFLSAGEQTGIAVLDALEKLVEYNAYLYGIVQAFTVLAGESTAEQAPGRPWFQERYQHVRGMIADALRSGVKSGEVREGVNCDAVAVELMAVMDGLQIQWLLAPDDVDMPAVFRPYVQRLRDSLAP